MKPEVGKRKKKMVGIGPTAVSHNSRMLSRASLPWVNEFPPWVWKAVRGTTPRYSSSLIYTTGTALVIHFSLRNNRLLHILKA